MWYKLKSLKFWLTILFTALFSVGLFTGHIDSWSYVALMTPTAIAFYWTNILSKRARIDAGELIGMVKHLKGE